MKFLHQKLLVTDLNIKDASVLYEIFLCLPFFNMWKGGRCNSIIFLLCRCLHWVDRSTRWVTRNPSGRTTFPMWFHAESSNLTSNSSRFYSLTTHPSQGQTLSNVVIYLKVTSRTDDIAGIYVTLPRVKRLTDLIILRHFDYKILLMKPSKSLLAEIERLDKLYTTETQLRFDQWFVTFFSLLFPKQNFAYN